MTQIVPISYCEICTGLISPYDTVMIRTNTFPFEKPNPNMGIAFECAKKTSHVFHAKCLKTKLTICSPHAKYRSYNKNCPTCQKEITHVSVLNPDVSRKHIAILYSFGDILIIPQAIDSTRRSILKLISEVVANDLDVPHSFFLFDKIP